MRTLLPVTPDRAAECLDKSMDNRCYSAARRSTMTAHHRSSDRAENADLRRVIRARYRTAGAGAELAPVDAGSWAQRLRGQRVERHPPRRPGAVGRVRTI